jgi:flagellar protein FlgJ
MLAQAAHETGWGRKDIRHEDADGSPRTTCSASRPAPGWKGPVAEVDHHRSTSTASRAGMVQKFRAYDSHAESLVPPTTRS